MPEGGGGIDEKTGKRHDDLGRQRNAGRFDAHQCGNTGVAAQFDDMLYELEDEGDDLFIHGRSQYIGWERRSAYRELRLGESDRRETLFGLLMWESRGGALAF